MLSGICRVKFGHFFPPSLTRVARSAGQKKVPEFLTVYTTWRAELFALYILLRGVPNPVCRRTLLFYRGAVGWGRGRDRGPNPRKADQLENVKYCVWWRRKLCLTMSWTKCSKNWPRPRPFKPWFTTFWSLQSRRPQRAGFWSRYSQKIRAKAALKTDENDKKQSPRRAGEVRPFSHADSGGFIFSRGTPLSSLICRTFLYAAADYRISWNELEIPLKNNCLWLCRGLWSRTLVFDRCDVYLRLSSIIETRWKIFQRKPSFFIDLIGRNTLFEICSISGKCLLIIFRSGCRARQRTFPPAGDLFMFPFSWAPQWTAMHLEIQSWSS